MTRSHRVLALVIFAMLLASCSGHASQSVSPRATGSSTVPSGHIRAATGSDEASLRASIARIRAAGDTPRFVTVTTARGTHYFSVTAQIVRSKLGLIVRDYSLMYVWPNSDAKVTYGDGAAVPLARLPLVDGPQFDSYISPSFYGLRVPTKNAKGEALCADCALILSSPRKTGKNAWSAIRDYWQEQPDWTNAGKGPGERGISGWYVACAYGEYGAACSYSFTDWNPYDYQMGPTYDWDSSMNLVGSSTGEPPPLGPLQDGCASDVRTAGTAYAHIGSSDPHFNDIGSTGNPNGTELHGYVYYNENTHQYGFDGPVEIPLDASGKATPYPPTPMPGYHVVGIYHTHPHDPTVDPTQVDSTTHNHFSPADIDFSDNESITMYVAVLDSIGTADAGNPQVRWYSRAPHSGTGLANETLRGVVGQGGC